MFMLIEALSLKRVGSAKAALAAAQLASLKPPKRLKSQRGRA